METMTILCKKRSRQAQMIHSTTFDRAENRDFQKGSLQIVLEVPTLSFLNQSE